MVQTAAPVDWEEVIARFRAGETATALAREFPVTRQAIAKQAKKRGADNTVSRELRRRKIATSDNPQPVAATATATATATNGATVDRKAVIAELLTTGCNKTEAALAAGVSRRTLYYWLQDEDYAALIAQAEGEFVARNIRNIAKAGDRGDWRASERLLQANKIAGGRFNARAATPSTQSMVAVQIDRGSARVAVATGGAPVSEANEINDLDAIDGDVDGF